MDEEPQSDLEDVSASEDGSVASDHPLETPATPISTTSTRYPSELKTHLCPFETCTKAFNRPARLQEHLRSHYNERLFACTYEGCDKTFLRASHLNHHTKSAHSGARDYICDRPGCEKSFVTGSRLRRHLAAHDGSDKYRCTEHPPCSETFRKHSTLQKHIMTVHLKQKPFPCPHTDAVTGQRCSMAFDTAGHLRAHASRLHTEKRFSCTECSQQATAAAETDSGMMNAVTFPTYAMLQAHIRAVHPPQCPSCFITCSTSRELRRHLEITHGDVSVEDRKIFACTVPGCERSFTKKGNLTVHVRTVHEGEKRFACGETDLSTSKKVAGWDGLGCGKRYGTKLALEEHVRTAHLGFPNAKAERRQRLGLTPGKKATRNNNNNNHDIDGDTNMSTLATLTGAGYPEESGRSITCFIESCAYRFHRDYDLWVHMSGKHGCSEDETRDLFLRRALLMTEGDQCPSRTLAPDPGFLGGLVGVDFSLDDDQPDHPYELYSLGDHSDGPELNRAGAKDGETSATIPAGEADLTLIDPLLVYNLTNG